MSTTIASPVFQPTNNREIIAGTVRAELSARKVRVSHLPSLIGNSREYWRRRVTDATTALDIDDLTALADLLGVSVPHLVRDARTAPRPDPLVGPAGIEPTTSTVEERRFDIIAENVTRMRPTMHENRTTPVADDALTTARVVKPVRRIGAIA